MSKPINPIVLPPTGVVHSARAKGGRLVEWSGLERAMDWATGEVFNSVNAFTEYRRKVAKKKNPHPSKVRGFFQNSKGYWVDKARPRNAPER